MTLDELNALWSVDATIDESNIVKEAAQISRLHNKYYMLYAKEVLRVKKLRRDLKVLERDKIEWLNGTMSEEDLKARGWAPQRQRILRSDIDKYVESDKDVIELSLRIDYYEGIAKYLEDIIKQIHSRNFVLKTMVDWQKFQSGIN